MDTLQALVDFANRNQGALSAVQGILSLILTFVLAIATIVYVVETRRIRQADTEPALSIYTVPHDAYIMILELVVTNYGRGAARNAAFTIEADRDEILAREVRSLDVLTTLTYLPPGEKFRFFFGEAGKLLPEPEMKPIVITASYETEGGEKRAAKFVIDAQQYDGATRIGEPPEYESAKALNKIADALDGAISGLKRLKVTTSTDKQLADERKERLESVRRARAEGKSEE
ncbi:MAG: hypothetical protein ACRERC_17005 [Candidatus Binatia bacterium]